MGSWNKKKAEGERKLRKILVLAITFLIVSLPLEILSLKTAVPIISNSTDSFPHKILWDSSYDPLSHFSIFISELESRGYEVDELTNGPITESMLKEYDILVLVAPDMSFSTTEINTIINFVETGHGLLQFCAFSFSWADKANLISTNFGVTFVTDGIKDPTNYAHGSLDIPLIHEMKAHPVTEGVHQFVIEESGTFTIDAPAQKIAWGDEDSYCNMYPAGTFPPVLVVSEFSQGRAVFIHDTDIFKNHEYQLINEYDNKRLGLNIISWLTRTLVVDDDGPADFSSIQNAINAASDGDIIYVKAGSYEENVVVNKSISLIGENRSTTIIDGGGKETVVTIAMPYLHQRLDNVTFSGFTIQNSGSNVYYGFPDWGIVVGANGTNISHNIIKNNLGGMGLIGCRNNILTDNILSNNQYNFLVFGTSGHYNHSIDTSNTVDGKPIYYLTGVNNAVYDAQTNAGTIYLVHSNNVTVKDLTLTKNVLGAAFWNTTNSKIENVTTLNNMLGIWLGFSHKNVLIGNSVSDNETGIALDFGSSSNTIMNNNLSLNEAGISCYYANNNIIFHNNFINNTSQVLYMEASYDNIWDGGYPSGGNYWSDYDGIDNFWGENQNLQGSDMIGDTAYVIDEDNKDRYPLTEPYPMSSQFEDCQVMAISNSMITDFIFNKELGEISFNVATDTSGFCRVVVTKWLLDGAMNLLIDNVPATWSFSWSNQCHMINFTYDRGTHNVRIKGEYVNPCIPEFPDINRDGVIDIFDVVLVAKSFGKTLEDI